jgi:hypothetical protein
MGMLLHDVLVLVEVAEYLQVVPQIARTIETALLSQGITLHRSIAGSPTAWASLAFRVRSELVFKEAIVHIVGRWNEAGEDAKANLAAPIRDLCEHKHEELTQLKNKIESAIIRYYPPQMKRDPQETSSTFNRQSYANDIMGWMAITLFKHWFSSALVNDRGRHGTDGGFWLYTAIGQGGHAYLNETEILAFHAKFPMSSKGSAVFRDHLLDIKDDVRKIVAPLLENHSQLEPAEQGIKYLTCTLVKKEELPWFVEMQHKREQSSAPTDSQPRSFGFEDDEVEIDYENDNLGEDALSGLF